LKGELSPLLATALFHDYEDLISRPELWSRCALTETERNEFLNGFLSTCEWIKIYYLWSPNLKDEADNHLVELAVAGNAAVIITNNVKDFSHSELNHFGISIRTPKQFLNEF
ncbi:MAG: PIN domain-containing protein, partial [Verrucomicrobiota bacterium]